MQNLKIHPIANIFPPMSEAEFQALKADIQQYGQRESLWLYEGQVIDARHRMRACHELNRDPRTEKFDGFDPVAFVVSLNLHRRHLDESQRALVGGRLANLQHGQKRADTAIAVTQSDAAMQLKVSEDSIQCARKVMAYGAPELVKAVESGKVSVRAAATIAEVPIGDQRGIVAKSEHEILQAAKAIRAKRLEERRAERV